MSEAIQEAHGVPFVYAITRLLDRRQVALYTTREGAEKWMASNDRPESDYASYEIQVVPVLS